ALFEFGDELAEAARTYLPSALLRPEARSPDYVDRLRQERREFQERHPVASTVAGLSGSVAPFVAGPGAALARAAVGRTLPRTMARSAALGAPIGGAYTLGAGEGSLAERAENLPTGLALGAGIGA